MSKKTTKKMLGPTLQEFELVAVTDPAEFAALDRRCRAAEKAKAAAERKAGKRTSSKDVKSGPKRGSGRGRHGEADAPKRLPSRLRHADKDKAPVVPGAHRRLSADF